MKKIIILLLLIVPTLAVAANTPFSLKESGKLPSGIKYSLAIKEVPFQRTSKTQPDDGSMWGIDGGYPTFVVQKISLKLNGREADLPRKFWADISEISSAKIKEDTKKNIVLTIQGGDAAGSYVATFKFRKGVLVERLVRMGEMPDEIWEKTEIHHEEPKDE